MKKLALQAGLIASAAITLSACGFNPQNQHLSKQNQCATIQRKMLFADNFRSNNSEWQTQVNRQNLQKQFHDMKCYQVLEGARKHQPAK